MCYSWNEDFEKSERANVAQEDPRKTVPERRPEEPVRSERLTFWTVGRRDRATEEATKDRTLEKV